MASAVSLRSSRPEIAKIGFSVCFVFRHFGVYLAEASVSSVTAQVWWSAQQDQKLPPQFSGYFVRDLIGQLHVL
jgi:hypothetical protein